jgi:hypothetical protein
MPILAAISDELTSKIVLSLITSVTTALVFTVGRSFWESKLYPLWLLLFRKNDQEVSGIWFAVYDMDTGDQAVDKLTIKQYGHILKGTCEYTLTDKATKKASVRTFTLKGVLKNDIVAFHYTNDSRRGTGIGTLTLRITDDGGTLLGHGVFYDTVLSILSPQDYAYSRSNPTETATQKP